MALHAPAFHIIDDNFAEENLGLTTPTRMLGSQTNQSLPVARSGGVSDVRNTIVVATDGIKISNFDRSDPPGYVVNSVPRGNFNGNQFAIRPDARMPEINVVCLVNGFDLTKTPLFWRLQCRHVTCRHINAFRYNGACEVWEREWQGRSFKDSFTLFAPFNDTQLVYDYNNNDPAGVVCGGHGILSIAIRSSSGVVLRDHVHLRISAENPAPQNVLDYVDQILVGRDPNIIQMVRAIFAHEAGFRQFAASQQTGQTVTFRQGLGHSDPAQPDCPVRFSCPTDPPGFPLTSFDFGVGIAQFTKLRRRGITQDQAWDWRENVNVGINTFMAVLQGLPFAGLTWRAWAHNGWQGYNGTNATAARYANEVAASAEGQRVSTANVPASLNRTAETAPVRVRAQLAPPPPWPPSTI